MSSIKLSQAPYPGFERLSPIVYLKDAATYSNDASPCLIILCVWMGASSRLVAKYTSQYIELFPDSSILLLTTTPQTMFLISTANHHRLLTPAVEVLQRYPDQSFTAAIYSNGGVSSLTSLAKVYLQTTGRALPVQNMLIDSAPGDPTDLASGQKAMFISLPPVLRRNPQGRLFSGIIWLLFYLWAMIIHLGIALNPILTFRTALNDSNLLASGGKRTYVYSKEDEMVSWGAVESSAKDAEGKGWIVGLGDLREASMLPMGWWIRIGIGGLSRML